MTDTLTENVLFQSAADALRFAFNFSHQQYDRPLMNRLASGTSGDGKGLSGMDGAGQAGMIRRELRELSNLYQAVLIARYAPRSFPCSCGRSCCGGESLNFEWREAVSAVAAYACELVPGGAGKFRLRRSIAFRLYGSGERLSDIAEDCGVTERTVSAHASQMAAWLRGLPARRNRDAVPGVEQGAEEAFRALLLKAGLIEDS